ncbi:hypothetical protein B0J18DRAFT_406070 [Chaetomium sp. MPI-SDFR-AT-0129]|nr:hypothetical protein B0J18DRAFT_406070 [Chaetomium sp. MPI-SDFR-AT-0129]
MRGIVRAVLAGALLSSSVLAADVLETIGFSTCEDNTSVSVQRVKIKYDNEAKTVSFDVAGSSGSVQNVTAILSVTAYGEDIYSNSFDPCSQETFVEQLCPVPAGTFSAKGTQKIPEKYADLVPAIAFQVPDIAAMATLKLQSLETGKDVACIQSQVTNGKTASVPAVSYIAAGVAGAALILGGVSAAGAAIAGGGGAAAGGGSSAGGMGTLSPSFTEVFGWFHGMAVNGMMSVNYPPVYRSFSKNFGFSTGLIQWEQLQTSIDGFRAATGGNLTENSMAFLKKATLVYPDGSSQAPPSQGGSSSLLGRAAEQFVRLAAREIETSVNGTSGDASAGQEENGAERTVRVTVSGIKAYAEQLSIPSANTFMTILLIVAIVIAVIVVGILLVKVILEFWALFGSFPQSLAGFRKHYWGSIARAITSLILLLYGIWVLYCVFQFTRGDSWAAKTLAGVTLFLFTAILAFFCWKIWAIARKLKAHEGDTGGLYDDKETWVKYSLFYESYRRDYWWIFIPTLFYMFAKGCVIAAGDGHGMVQTVGQLAIEGVMLILLLWSRPYERKSSNIINITIQVVRVLSVACILIFVEEFGIAQTTQTVTGVVLIAVQSALTGVLTILIAWNAINACCKKNPHRARRKEMEKMQRRDTLTPLDARNSLLLLNNPKSGSDYFSSSKSSIVPLVSVESDKSAPPVPLVPTITTSSQGTTDNKNHFRSSSNYSHFSNTGHINFSRGGAPPPANGGFTAYNKHARDPSRENLVTAAAPPARGGEKGHQHTRSASSGISAVGGMNGVSGMDVLMRDPTVPNVGGGGGAYGNFGGAAQNQGGGGGYGGFGGGGYRRF